MKRDHRVLLQDILDSITVIQEHVEGLDQGRFLKERWAQDAVMRRLEVIGEAAKQIPPEIRAMAPGVRWADVAGMRDVLIHGYFGVDLVRVWQVVQDEVPGLMRQVTALLRRLDAPGAP